MAALTGQLQPISLEARPYPAYLLNGCQTGLAVFSAAFLGWNDVIHFARKGIQTTCVDRDGERLAEMEAIYPTDWEFVVSDAWEFADKAAGQELTWDVVTVDPFMGEAAEKVWRTLDAFLCLADRMVTVTVPSGWIRRPPRGWQHSLFPRARGVSWLVLRRA